MYTHVDMAPESEILSVRVRIPRYGCPASTPPPGRSNARSRKRTPSNSSSSERPLRSESFPYLFSFPPSLQTSRCCSNTTHQSPHATDYRYYIPHYQPRYLPRPVPRRATQPPSSQLPIPSLVDHRIQISSSSSPPARPQPPVTLHPSRVASTTELDRRNDGPPPTHADLTTLRIICTSSCIPQSSRFPEGFVLQSIPLVTLYLLMPLSSRALLSAGDLVPRCNQRCYSCLRCGAKEYKPAEVRETRAYL